MGAQSRCAITCHLLVQSDMSRAWLYKWQSTISLLPHTTPFPSLFGWAGSSSFLPMAPSPIHGRLPSLHLPARPLLCSLAWRRWLEEEDDSLSQWQVGPRRDMSTQKFQIFALPSNSHISSFRAPKITKLVLLPSLWNYLSVRSIRWHVLVEKVFYRNSYLKTGLENKRIASLHNFIYKNPKMMKPVLLVRCCHTPPRKNIKLICCSLFSWCVN
jgi:hypothetical protein